MDESLQTEAQGVLDRLRWDWADPYTPTESLSRRIAIVGLPGAGKRALCNSLWGWEVLDHEKPREQIREYGLFTVADLSGEMAFDVETILFRLEGVDLMVYLLDASAGLSAEDFRWIARLRSAEPGLLVVLNVAGILQEESQIGMLADLERRLALPVLPLDVRDGEAVHRSLIPAMLKACPELDVPLANEIGGLRGRMARRLVMQHVVMSAVISLEPVPLIDVSVLIGLQSRMVKRIAAVYGYRGRNDQRRDIMVSGTLGLALRYSIQTAAKAVPFAGWLVSGLVGASATWMIGRVAMAYYGEELPDPGQWMYTQLKRLRDALPSLRG
jgi:uncharacterized protein (DUF697 family)